MEEMVIINCAMCGIEMERTSPKHKYCKVCAYERVKRSAKAAKEREKREREVALVKEKSQEDMLCVLTLAGKTANRITAEARAFGMTYGTYSAAVRDGSIDKILKAKGFTDPEAILREVSIK